MGCLFCCTMYDPRPSPPFMTDDDVALYCALLVHLELSVFHSLWTCQSFWGGIRADVSVLERVRTGLISVSLSSPFVFLWKTSFWMALQNVGVLLKGVFKPETPFANAFFYGLLNTFTDTWWVLFVFWDERDLLLKLCLRVDGLDFLIPVEIIVI